MGSGGADRWRGLPAGSASRLASPWVSGESRRASLARSGALDGATTPASAPLHPAQFLDRLDTDLQEFRLQFGRFFAGDRPVPPEDLRRDLQARLRQARGGAGASGVRSVADTFRLTQLEAQFNTYSELFNRRLRQREEGPRRAPGARGTPTPIEAASGAATAAPAGPAIGLSPEAVAALHRTLYPAGAPDGSTDTPDLERFSAFLSSQVAALRRRTGCRKVVFRVSEDGGRRRLLARPVGGSSPAPE